MKLRSTSIVYKCPIGTIVDDLEVISYKRNEERHSTKLECKCRVCGRVKLKTLSELQRHAGTSHLACGKGMKMLDEIFHSKWQSLKQRIYNPNGEHWHRYGGRGLTCDYDSFVDFYDDMYESYKEARKTLANPKIDRINNDLGYIRGNLRWVDRKTNVNNSSKMKWFKAIDPTGKEYIAHNQCDFAKEHKLESRQINACLKGRFKTTLGWRFEFIDPESVTTSKPS